MPKPTTAVQTKPKKSRLSTVPNDETKEQAFKRLAIRRVNNALKHLGYIAALGSYPHTEAETVAIMSVIDAKVVAVKAALERKMAAKEAFSFSGNGR